MTYSTATVWKRLPLGCQCQKHHKERRIRRRLLTVVWDLLKHPLFYKLLSCTPCRHFPLKFCHQQTEYTQVLNLCGHKNAMSLVFVVLQLPKAWKGPGKIATFMQKHKHWGMLMKVESTTVYTLSENKGCGVHSYYKQKQLTIQTFRCFLELLAAFLLTPLPGFEDFAKSGKLAFTLWGIVPCAAPLSHHCAVVLLRFII